MIVIFLALLAAAIFLPQWWVRRVLLRYQTPADRYQGTGSQLARHLLDRLGLESVGVERTDPGADHYDPEARMVRLSPEHYEQSSLAAITVAAHEVGHAIQHADGYKPLMWRTRLVKSLARLQRLGVILIALMPVAILALRLPRAGIILLVLGLATLASGIVVHLMTLPTELDASFRRALPLLEKGGYLKPGDQPHARRILTAAAFTYVAASLMGLVNFWWWLRILRP
ncbi:MAG: zinc metallopeptidase [Wenzhouxiangella sp.]|nr:zinc metallopeptidase [Wenzhouxiangella sp.]MCH8476811.1 zinc metallopeptidase [Wenzhouxiangella sp.]TVR95021.1 MAG: zinc metallopeptidase [Wenzhouxiangellaceae bacterium]